MSSGLPSFALFIFCTGVLFVRPTELMESLAGLPLYEVPVVICLVLSGSRIFAQCSGPPLRQTPTTFCVIGLVFAILFSHLQVFAIDDGINKSVEFLKVILSYLLLVAVLHNASRLRQFMGWLLAFILILTALALCQHHGLIDNPALAAAKEKARDEESGEEIGVHKRMSGAGLFGNPNDLARILVVGITLSLYFFDGGAPALFRPVWVTTAGVFGYALTLTMSRGGLIALGVTLVALAYARFGPKRTMVLVVLMLPALAALGGRQGNISTSSGTGQQRIQLWSDGLEVLRSTPLFGVGAGNYEEIAGGLGAHNSFVHAYVELGFLGGTLFFGAIFGTLWACARTVRQGDRVADPVVRRVGPYVFAILAGYTAGMISSSRCYVIPTYVLLGLVVAYLRLARADLLVPSFRVTGRAATRLALGSVMFLFAIQMYVKTSVQFSP